LKALFEKAAQANEYRLEDSVLFEKPLPPNSGSIFNEA
jgi:hypothetical protein